MSFIKLFSAITIHVIHECIRVPKQVLVQKLSFSISSNSQACIVEHHGPFSQFNN